MTNLWKCIIIACACVILGACASKEDPKITAAKNAAKFELRDGNISFSKPAFMDAAKNGNIKAMQLFLDAGMDVNAKDNGTALTYAVYANNIKSVKFLIEHHADVNESSYWGTPLGVASYKDFYDIAELLIHNGANVNEVSRNGMTPLFNAVLLTGKKDIVKLLLENGADPNFEQTNTKETALTLAAGKGYLGIVKLLVDGGADVNYHDSGNLTPMDWALLDNHTDVARILLENGAAVSGENSSDRPMVYALERSDYVFAELLIKHGVSVNAKAFGKMPFIVWSAKRKLNEGVKFLVDHGADINAADSSGQTALDYALENKDMDLVKYLKTAKPVKIISSENTGN